MQNDVDFSLATNQLILNKLEKENFSFSIEKHQHILYAKGSCAFDNIDTKENFYFIMDGKIKISQINADTGKEQVLYLLSRGDMFDVVTLLDNRMHEYISTVLEDSVVVEVPIENVRELIENDSEFQRFFFPYIAKQLRSMENLATDLSLYDVYHRLIRLFARFADKNNTEDSLKLIGNLSHEEIASMVGSVRKVVNRNLQKLKKEGVLELSRNKLKLKNLQKLLDKLPF